LSKMEKISRREVVELYVMWYVLLFIYALFYPIVWKWPWQTHEVPEMTLSEFVLGVAFVTLFSALIATFFVLLADDEFRNVLKGKILSAIYNVRIICGVARSWLWFIANDVDNPDHFYCPHIKERMLCFFCPHYVRNETKEYTEWYCELARKKLMEGKTSG